MLLQFTVGNYKSFKDKVTLSMEATADDWLEEDNVALVEKPELRLVKIASIYGANASGKSNLIDAMVRFRSFVRGSSKDSQLGDPIPVSPFRLNTDTEVSPTLFEVVFLKNGTRYRYGFEANALYVISEWLFEQGESIRETTLFTREGDLIQCGATFKEGKGLEERTRPNALFLSVVAQFNGKTAGVVMSWVEQFRTISGLNEDGYRGFTVHLLQDPEYAQSILELTQAGDPGILSILREDIDRDRVLASIPDEFPNPLREFLEKNTEKISMIKAQFKRFNSENMSEGIVELDSNEWSDGTRHLFAISGPFLHSLREGSVLIVDELDARLHPLLTRKLVVLFNSSANKKGAQLIFATHDSGLLDQKSMRRDQIWFVEKNARGASELFSLAEIKGVRKDANFEREYLLGQFGGVPRVGDLRSAVAHAEE